MLDIARLTAQLGLQPHPEGGFYREYLRSPEQVVHPIHGALRPAVTGIWFLLPPGSFSALHRVASTEVWHHLEGDPVELHLFDASGGYQRVLLGRDGDGVVSQHAVPPGVWQASVPVGSQGALCGCTVAPGFVFDDFEMPDREVLLAALPAHAGLVTRLTRGPASPG